MEEYTPDILTLEDEAGVEHVFEVIDALDHGGEHYLAVVPYVETEEEAQAALADDADLIIMRVGEENGEEFLDIVDDDLVLTAAHEAGDAAVQHDLHPALGQEFELRRLTLVHDRRQHAVAVL